MQFGLGWGVWGGFGLIITEHIAHKQQSNKLPSVALTYVAEQFQRFFQWIGELVAWVSSFLTIINLYELVKSISAILNPILDIIVSPLHTIYGYLQMANSYSNNLLVYIGSGLLVAAVGAAWYHFNQPKQTHKPTRPRKVAPRQPQEEKE